MKTRKIPERTCVVTREKYPKKELLRIVRSKEGIVQKLAKLKLKKQLLYCIFIV